MDCRLFFQSRFFFFDVSYILGVIAFLEYSAAPVEFIAHDPNIIAIDILSAEEFIKSSKFYVYTGEFLTYTDRFYVICSETVIISNQAIDGHRFLIFYININICIYSFSWDIYSITFASICIYKIVITDITKWQRWDVRFIITKKNMTPKY